MYAGFRNSYGPVPAAVLTTAIFWLMHIGEMIHFWPAMLGVAGFALLALWLRLRFKAIGPSVAAHIAYNTIISTVMLLATTE